MGIVNETEFESDRKSGLDYLSFWAYGSFKNAIGLELELEQLQRNARDRGHEMYFRRGKHEIKLLPSSSGPYGVYHRKFQLIVGGVYFGICSCDPGDERPGMKVEIKGAELLQLGEKKAVEFIWDVMESLGFECSATKVSRFDLRADCSSFTVRDVVNAWEKGCGVSLAKKYVTYRGERYQKIEAFYAGVARKGGICCRFYDKLDEVGSNNVKRATLDTLILEGQEVEDLTRVEFQVNREAIKDRYGIETVDDLFGSLERIADDLTRNWIRIHKNSLTKGNTARDKNDDDEYHKIWKSVRSALFEFCAEFETRLPKIMERVEQTVERQAKTVYGYVCKIAALKGLKLNGFRDLYRLVDDIVLGVDRSIRDVEQRVEKESKLLASRRLNDALSFFDSVGKGKRKKQADLEFLC